MTSNVSTYLYDVDVRLLVLVSEGATDLVVFEPLDVRLKVTHDHFTFKFHIVPVRCGLVNGALDDRLC
jgi:hypothetical protein